MAERQQRGNKEAKKPKKDAGAPKPGSSDRPVPPMTAVLPKGKEAKKLR
jgi:hypothetical protein